MACISHTWNRKTTFRRFTSFRRSKRVIAPINWPLNHKAICDLKNYATCSHSKIDQNGANDLKEAGDFLGTRHARMLLVDRIGRVLVVEINAFRFNGLRLWRSFDRDSVNQIHWAMTAERMHSSVRTGVSYFEPWYERFPHKALLL